MSTILIVDPAESARGFVVAALRRIDHVVLEAETAAEALLILASGVVDLAVLEVELPDLAGEELAQVAQELCEGVPVLFISASGRRVAGFGVLGKPFSPNALYSAVNLLLGI